MIITSHPAYPSAQQAAEQKKLSIYAYLEQLVEATARDRQLQDRIAKYHCLKKGIFLSSLKC